MTVAGLPWVVAWRRSAAALVAPRGSNPNDLATIHVGPGIRNRGWALPAGRRREGLTVSGDFTALPGRPSLPKPSCKGSVCERCRTLYTWTKGSRAPVSAARRALREALNRAGLAGEVVDGAALAASELVANATEHAVGPYKMVLRRSASGLVCEVHDHDPYVPVFPHPAPDELPCDGDSSDEVVELLAERGRGLRIVDQLTVGRWGFDRIDDGGKVAWMSVSVSDDACWTSTAA
ncbi:ATP-binding protein [Streptomyces sp. NBC_01764]|uniref:ATP-binding protein n=1 Tax=Streptomyces sp. NBC_01764 TaxID=2975935 RepID=UPI002B1CC166|nr:ATP-binding protein [Streptomyces sp. NBC_01764]